MREPTAQATVEIAAPPEVVYRLVSDVEALPEWAAEVTRNEWLRGATGPAVGARWRGWNEHAGRKWPTTAEVTHADEGRRFAFKVQVLPGMTTALWSYTIEPTETGCRVTESTTRLAPLGPTRILNRLLGVHDRDRHNQANIEKTLARLKETAEGQNASH